jgi:RNA polymerase sigma-70 factor (ECF subfamily)
MPVALAALEPSPDRGDGFFAWVTRLVHEHRGRLVRVARREGLRAEDALDCAQEAFLGFLQLPQARLLVDLPDDSARLLTILARNIARNRRRRHDLARPHTSDRAVLEEIALDQPSADELVSQAERRALMMGCLTTLNTLQQRVVRLRLLDDAAGDDVARQIGVTPAHLAVLAFRAKRQLRSCAEETGAG